VRAAATWIRTVAVVIAGVLALAACGTSATKSTVTESLTGDKPCGTVNLAINPWVGYAANAAVVAYIAKNKLGCTVVQSDLTEEQSWQGFSNGSVDVIIENWGHDDFKKKYIDQEHIAVEDGVTGNKGVIGWYIPPWMVKEHPDITDWHNLNKYAKLFRTSGSGGKGVLYDGDPSYVTNDEALVRNLKLDFKVVFTGSEDALIKAFRTAEADKTPMLGYFYQPQWFLSEVELVHIPLPAYRPGCDVDPKQVACDYQPYDLEKIVRTQFADSGSAAATLVKNFHWTDKDQNSVARDIASSKLSPEAAAKKWVDANPEVWQAWLSG
jgi:glycine betaine/proline transport system substrate-binding protein